MNRLRALAGLLWMLSALLGGAAHAHKPSDSYLALRVENASISGQWDVALRDLDFAIGLDANDDGEITWGELRARHSEIAAYALARLALVADGQPCAATATEHLVDSHSDGTYAVIRFAARCPTTARQLQVGYRLFFDFDRQHKGLYRLEYAGTTRTGIFTPDRETQAFTLAETSGWQQVLDYLVEGVWHIWIGFDHILFLVCLLLPSVMIRRDGRWVGVDSFRAAFVEVLKVVTAFTVAHSITLSLATLGVLELPSRLVESAIALSVVVAALNNLAPRVDRRRWLVAFAFGLVHGFGFASVLADLGLPQDALVLALLGFNLGVEIGQLAIVSAILPLAFVTRHSTSYRTLILGGGSVAIALVAAVWFAERAFELKLLPF